MEEINYNDRKVWDFITCWDDPNTGYAYNLYQNNRTGELIKEDVWDNAGARLITLKTNIKVIKSLAISL